MQLPIPIQAPPNDLRHGQKPAVCGYGVAQILVYVEFNTHLCIHNGLNLLEMAPRFKRAHP